MKLVAAVVFLFAQVTFAQLPTNTIPDCIGVNIHFTDPQPGEMKMLADAGFRWVRMDFNWEAIETKPGQYDFSAYDRLLAALDEHHIRALLILDYANPLYDNNESPHSDQAIAAFAKWAAASAQRFKGRGVIWEMYNEPNGFWRPHPGVQQYIKLALSTGKAIKSATPDELHIGPGVSGFDPGFMEACLQAGLLQYWDAVSVHPYGQDEPETRGESYRELRVMIEKCKPKGKTVPILSGEWGFSSVWNSFTPELQGKYLAREFLFNCWQNLPLSIWYDWHDDGPDPKEPEHHFGTVLQNYDPKPAYLAAKTLTTQLGGFAFNKRLALAKPDEFMLLFSKGDEVRVAAWTSSREPRKVNLPASPGAFSVVSHLGESLPKLSADEKGLSITLTDSVQYLTPDAPNDLLRVAAAWERLPLEMVTQWPAHALIRPVLDNPLDRALDVIRQNGTRDSVAPHRILRDAILFDTLRQPVATPRRVQYHIEGLGDIAQAMQVSISNPLIIIPLAPTGDAQPVRVDNPSGEAASLLVKRTGSSVGSKLDFETNQTTKLVDLPGDVSKDIEIYSADGAQLEATAHAPRFVPITLDPTHFEIRAEGDGNVKSTQSFTKAPAPPGAPVKFETSLRIDYTFDAGWKYALLKPRGAAAKIDGKPIALAFWLKGDGSGNVPRLRFTDSTGQTFQPDGERLVYKDWRYASYSLDGSGAGRWGGADDGLVHYPIRIDTLLLIDSGARQATSASVHIAAPVLIYPR